MAKLWLTYAWADNKAQNVDFVARGWSVRYSACAVFPYMLVSVKVPVSLARSAIARLRDFSAM